MSAVDLLDIGLRWLGAVFAILLATVGVGFATGTIRRAGQDETPPDWTGEDPAVVAAARANCAMPKGEPPCVGCMTQVKRIIRAYKEAANAP